MKSLLHKVFVGDKFVCQNCIYAVLYNISASNAMSLWGLNDKQSFELEYMEYKYIVRFHGGRNHLQDY